MANKLQDRLASKTAELASRVEASTANRTERAASTMPGQLGAFRLDAQKWKAQIEELQAENTSLKRNSVAGEIELDKLVEVPGRRKYMSPEKYHELRENLRHNPLIQPISISLVEDGKAEIVSGHHRSDVFKEFGRKTIPYTLFSGAKEQRALAAFYANLLQDDITDYEKYLGFKLLREARPGTTQAQMAEESGISDSIVSDLLAFDDLPPDVLNTLSEKPYLLGSKAGAALASLSRRGKSKQVIDAVALLAEGKVDQAHAVKLASAEPKSNKAAVDRKEVRIKSGRSVFCTMTASKKTFRLEFSSEQVAEGLREKIQTYIEALAREVTDK